MTVYAKHFSTKQTPQSEPIPGSSQVPNSAGGYAFAVDNWTRLDRFLILGSVGGSYYTTEQKLTVENAQAVLDCIKEDGTRTVKRIREISVSGRAPKNDPAIFALALAMGQGDLVTRQMAGAMLPDVCRIPTHLFAFLESVEAFRGHGRSLNRSLRRWYCGKESRELAYQCVKYQQRNGWSHRDVLRLCRPKAGGLHQDIFHWIVKGWSDVGAEPHPQEALLPIWSFERAKRASSKEEIVQLIRDFRLVRECIPTQWLAEPAVWEALLAEMPLTAMIRNLATMTRIGLLAPMSNAAGKVVAELANVERLRKSRIHPVAVLAALLTYQAGRGERGKSTWNPVAQIVDALDGAFYQSFGNVEPTGKRWLLALDVSGSMNGVEIAGVPGLTARVASAALALVTAAVEPQHAFIAFTSYNGLTPLSFSSRQRLDDVCRQMAELPMGRTDCALPMLYALGQRLEVDAFVVLTDSETWHGRIHPCQALCEYRQRMGIPAKMIVCGMVSNGFTISDPNDGGSMDVVGFDTNVPALMSDFVRG